MQEKEVKNLSDIRREAERAAKEEYAAEVQREYMVEVLSHGLVVQTRNGRYMWAGK